MTVFHSNSSLQGGAAIAALRIHQSAKLAGLDSKFYHLGHEQIGTDVLPDPRAGPPTFWIKGITRLRSEISRARSKPKAEFDFYPLPWPGNSLPRPEGVGGPDILHFHWMQGWMTYKEVVPRSGKIVVTLHDMNAFTGGCIYDWGCGRFAQGCGQCPQLGQPGKYDASHLSAERKREFWAGVNVHVVAPSQWMLEQARRSVAFQGASSFTHIPYGLDLTTFYPIPKTVAREALGLGEDKVTILFGAAGGASDPRKGFRLLTEALGRMPDSVPLRLLTFGQSAPDASLPRWVESVHLGQLTAERLQALVYSAADLTVVPSIQDNSPQVVLESMACGTPVLGTQVGGIPEVIRHGETGWLASPSAGDMAEVLRMCLDNPAKLHACGGQSRKYVESHHSLLAQGQAYKRLYDQVIGSCVSVA